MSTRKYIVSGSPPWNMRIIKVKENGDWLPYWRGNSNTDIVEWIEDCITEGELNDVLDFIVIDTRTGEQLGTIRDYYEKYCK